jgi:hypothetical protein
MNLLKRIVAITTVFAVLFGITGPAQAATVAELEAQIAALLAQLSTLQSQLAALGGGTGVTGCAISSFTRNLSQGMSGDDVKCLQIILNSAPDTQVAASGVGSSGQETMYFGPLTFAAVVKFQEKYASEILAVYGLTTGTGYVGTTTRAKLDALLGGGVVPPPVTCGTGTCDAGETYASCPTDCPFTDTTCEGGEGSYTVLIAAEPVGATVNGGAGIEAYGIDITAVNSDITIGKIDLQVSVAVGATTYDPGTFINAFHVYLDSVSDANLVKTIDNPSFTLDTSNVYYAPLTGLTAKVPMDETHTVLIVMDTVGSMDNNRTVTLNVYGNNGIRGRDCAGIDSYMALATTRVFTVRPVSGNATFTFSLAPDNPDSQNYYSNSTTGITTDTPVLVFRGKAQSGNVVWTTAGLAWTTGASEAIPSVLKIKDSDDTLIASCTPNANAGECRFTNFRYPVTAEETEEFTYYANWAAMTDTSINIWQGVQIPATSAANAFERADGSRVNATIAAALATNPLFIYEQGVKLSLVSASATGAAPISVGGGTTSSTGTITFKAEPFGGTLTYLEYVSEATGTLAAGGGVWLDAIWASGTGISGEASAGSTAITVARTIAQTPPRNVFDGESATVTVTETIGTDASGNSGNNLRYCMYGLTWTVGNNANFYTGNGSGGNLMDTWCSPWVYFNP